MPCTDNFGVIPRKCHQTLIVAFDPDQAFPGRFQKRQAELRTGNRSYNRFRYILNGLDEMGLPKNKIHVFGFVNFHNLEFHTFSNHVYHTGELGM